MSSCATSATARCCSASQSSLRIEAASGGWRGCGFLGYAGEGAQEWVELDPGESAVFELEPVCKEIFLDLASHTEFRVGNETVPVDDAWWTTSALVAPLGRADEGASGNTALPSSYDARAFYGASGGEELTHDAA